MDPEVSCAVTQDTRLVISSAGFQGLQRAKQADD